MENIETLEHFQSTIDLYKNLFNVDPELIAYDLHPDYLSTRYARELEEAGAKTIGILHHHAHIASCMAENGINSPVIGVVLDGTGWGNDGNIWGGEYVVADYNSFTRSAHLEYLPLAGGDTATKRPYRITAGYLLSLLGDKALDKAISLSPQYYNRFNGESTESFHSALSPTECKIIKQQIQKKINTPQTSSMGRLFDAVSALIGVREVIDYEGQAAIELEMAAHAVEEHSDIGSYPYAIVDSDGMQIIKLADLFSAIIEDIAGKQPRESIAMKFHRTVANMSVDICRHLSEQTGIKKVALSGGVFQNRLLLRQLTALLEKDGFHVITHRLVPCNDGCISLGQAVIANFSG
jgi:hydrogenase maturation protein HypF